MVDVVEPDAPAPADVEGDPPELPVVPLTPALPLGLVVVVLLLPIWVVVMSRT